MWKSGSQIQIACVSASLLPGYSNKRPEKLASLAGNVSGNFSER